MKDTPVASAEIVKTEKPAEITGTDTMAMSVEKLAKSVSELGIGKDRANSKNNRGKLNFTCFWRPISKPKLLYIEKRMSHQHPTKSSSRSQSTRKSRRRSQTNGASVVPEQDFDFASANAKFDKEQIMRSLAKKSDETEGAGAGAGAEARRESTSLDEAIVIPEADVYYDKSKSFFDDISCDAKERAEAKKSRSVVHTRRTPVLMFFFTDGSGPCSADYRRKHQEEKKLNLETFGEISVDIVGRNSRGGIGGGGGRGRNNRRASRRRNVAK